MKEANVCVLGAGVVGLSCAITLLNKFEFNDQMKITVTIIAESFIQNTTSCGSAGLWEPYKIEGTSDELVNNWGKHSLDHFLQLLYSPHAAEAGVQLMTAYKLFTYKESLNWKEPSWKDIVFNFRKLCSADLREMKLPEEFVAGCSFETLVIEQKYYLTYLTKLLLERGVTFEQRKVICLDELKDRNFHAIINCCGLGSFHLLNDTQMYPIRGQVLRVKAPWMKNIWFWGKSYIIPNLDNVVCGGTADYGEWDVTPSLSETTRILNDISHIFPAFQNATIENVWVGLRPGRTPLRLDMEMYKFKSKISEGSSQNNNMTTTTTSTTTSSSSSLSSVEIEVPLFHCYGHGGSGVTLAMGCAHDLITNLVIPTLQKLFINTNDSSCKH